MKNGILKYNQDMVHFLKEGDIFSLKGVSSYAHGCNCAGAMGKGIALQFRNRYPAMYKEYKLLCQCGRFNPGDVFDFNYGEGYVYNLATQVSWRTQAKIEYIRKALNMMCKLAVSQNVKSIALPAIGAGLGGLHWDEVKVVIRDISLLYSTVDLYVVETYRAIV